MGGKGRSQETGEEGIALVRVSDDGNWTRVGTKEVKYCRFHPHLPIHLLLIVDLWLLLKHLKMPGNN